MPVMGGACTLNLWCLPSAAGWERLCLEQGFWMGSGEDCYVNANVYEVPLEKKYVYKAYRVEEESKHCSAPGSQVLTDFFSPSLTWQEKERVSVLFPAFHVPVWHVAVAWEPWACCAMAALAKTPGSVARALLGGCLGCKATRGSCWESASDAPTTAK